jgi:hypothetical protein
MSKNSYAIIRIKTGKLITESEKLPIFWNKKNADFRAKDFIGVKVIPISNSELVKLINKVSNEQ